MATSKTEKTTIPPAKDPLGGVTYTQAKPKPAIPERPIDSLIPDTTKQAQAPAQEETPPAGKKPNNGTKPRKEKMTVVIPDELLERVRNAAYWSRESLADLAEEGLRLVVQRLERENGGPFQPRAKALRRGRPQGSKNLADRAH
jgi:hypothetical protein